MQDEREDSFHRSSRQTVKLVRSARSISDVARVSRFVVRSLTPPCSTACGEQGLRFALGTQRDSVHADALMRLTCQRYQPSPGH